MDAIQQNESGSPRFWGIASCVLFLLATLAGLDALQSYWRTPHNAVSLVGGESVVISGPMPDTVTQPQYLHPIWLGTAKLSFTVVGESENAPSQQGTWQATLHAGKVQHMQTGTLVVEDLLLGSDTETGTVTKIQNKDLVYSLFIYPSADAMHRVQPGILARYVGIAGVAVAAFMAALGCGCAVVYWLLRRKSVQAGAQLLPEE